MITVSGEAASSKDSIGSNTAENFRRFRPQDVFNADETEPLYKCLPNKSLSFRRESYSSQKIPKERVSILCAANMDSTEKLPLLVIGKFGQSRCFKGIRTLPVTYRHNKKAWMTGALFEEWVHKLNRHFLLDSSSVALILDNCSPTLKLE